MMSGTRQLDTIKDAIASGSGNKQRLGDIVYFGLRNAMIDRTSLLAIWANFGLDEKLLPKEPTPEKALKEAVSRASVGLDKDIEIKKAVENNDSIIFTISQMRVVNVDGDVVWDQKAKVVLDRKAVSLSSDNPGNDVVQNIMAKFAILRQTHTEDDVRLGIIKTFHSFSSITLRDGGGIYWIPEFYADRLRRLQAAVEQIGQSKVYLLPIFKTTEAERALSEAATESIEAELSALEKEIEKFLTSPPSRTSTLSTRLEHYNELRAKAELYKTVLHCEVEGLAEKLNKMASTIEGLIEQKGQIA